VSGRAKAVARAVLACSFPRGLPPAGVVKPGEDVEVVGLRDTIKSTITGVEMFKKNLSQGQAGDNVGLLIRSIKRDDVSRGQVVCKPGTLKTYKVGWRGGPVGARGGQHMSPGEVPAVCLRHTQAHPRCAAALRASPPSMPVCETCVLTPGGGRRVQNFEAEVYALTKDEGGRHTPFTSKYKPQFFIRTADVSGAGQGAEGNRCDVVSGSPSRRMPRILPYPASPPLPTPPPPPRPDQPARGHGHGHAGRQLHGLHRAVRARGAGGACGGRVGGRPGHGALHMGATTRRPHATRVATQGPSRRGSAACGLERVRGDARVRYGPQVGLRFAIRDSGRTVGAGVVTKLM
jgi:hypothetical protein